MDFALDPELEAFRSEVREFLRDRLPEDCARFGYHGFQPTPKEMCQRWTGILHARGWSAPHWPKEYGGPGWCAMRQFIFEDECYRADAPMTNFQALRLVGPVVYTFGSEAQKKRWLPGILSGSEYWCQGFSEPGSGSDLASLRTAAQREGDHFIVNGQKIWTSEAHMADMGFFLVRTDPHGKAQESISFLLIDMRTPGITVRPILSLDGVHHLNEVFLDNVRVPAENLVGEAGKGWSYAKYLLDNERTAAAEINWSKRDMAKACEIARSERTSVEHARTERTTSERSPIERAAGSAVFDEPSFRKRQARLEANLLALEWSVLRILSNERTVWNPNAVTSALKVAGARLHQQATELQADALGLLALRHFAEHDAGTPGVAAQAWPDYVPGKSAGYLFSRATSIYGGTNEVQKTIIAKAAFKL